VSARSALSQVVLPANPATANEAATKSYVDTTTLPVTARGVANGVAPLDSGLLVPIAHLPATGPGDLPNAVGDSNNPGTSVLLSRADHTHNGVPTAAKGAANGVATLDGGTKVPLAQLPTGTTTSTVALGSHAHAQADVTDLTTDLAARQLTSAKNAANGYAGLDASSKLTGSQQVYAAVGTIVAVANASAAGTSDTAARGDHTHAGVSLTGNQTIAGVKTFSSSPIVPTPTTSTQAAPKSYADLMIPLTQRAAASGVATLGSDSKIPIAQMPTGLLAVSALANITSPVAGQMALLTTDSMLYRYTGSAWLGVSHTAAGGGFARYKRSTVQSVPTNTLTKIALTTAVSTHADISANGTFDIFTVNRGGTWRMEGNIAYPSSNAGTGRTLWIGSATDPATVASRYNLVNVQPNPSWITALHVTATLSLAAGTQVALWTYQDSGAAVNTDVSQIESSFSMFWEGP